MAFLTKTAILTAEDMKYDSVPCPEWGGDGRVRGLTAYEQGYVTNLIGDDKKSEVTLKVVQFGCVDENGERLFSSEDIKQLQTKSYAVVERVGKRILQLTGFGNQDEIDTAKKN